MFLLPDLKYLENSCIMRCRCASWVIQADGFQSVPTYCICKNHWLREFDGKLEHQKKRDCFLLVQQTKGSNKEYLCQNMGCLLGLFHWIHQIRWGFLYPVIYISLLRAWGEVASIFLNTYRNIHIYVCIKKNRKRLLPPTPSKSAHFMAESSGLKGASLFQSCLQKLTDLNIDKCSCLVFVTLGNSHKYLCQKLQSILAAPLGSSKYNFGYWQAGFVCCVSAWAEHVPVSSKDSS